MSANHTTADQAQAWYRSMMHMDGRLSEIVSSPYDSRPVDLSIGGCRSDFEVGSLLGDIQVIDYPGLKAISAAGLALDSADADAKAHRAEMITAVRGGKHMSLAVTALTFRQRKAPNRRYLRLAADKLADRAPSWKGQPFLTDHNTYNMKASQGMIASSKLVEESTNISAFEQVLHAVTPEAVIGFLNGTWRKFSVGWFALGPVNCSVHECDIRSADSCSCWPGETVMVDGKPKVVEYEFSDYEGKEVSTVVIPAVRDTSVSDIRAALTAELHLPARRSTPPKEQTKMAGFPKLTAALALASLTDADEDRAVGAVTALRERVSAAELDAGTLRADNARLTAELAVQTQLATQAATAAIDGLLADAYKAGKLVHGKDAEGKNTPDGLESLLRDYGVSAGRDKLAAKLTGMKSVVPIGQRQLTPEVGEPAKTALVSVPTDAEIARAAAQLQVPENDLRAQYGMPLLAAGGGK